ncbi:CHY zinc finger protein [Nesterenkonia flava]|uniref:CHY zinc finger protein n=1 Tax=Nesterenkonia flava TaxID=469799 RepID=A0ABU1FRL9_9MICC|nr:CHY zinc finger protein [Nesterenkonia flava]MDR5710823.1 CHY zinc finger protein [Nesterenkonia flava]
MRAVSPRSSSTPEGSGPVPAVAGQTPPELAPEVSAPVVRGPVVDSQTRCVHYHSALDVVAIRFFCCGNWYPCLHCHDGVEAHPRSPWPQGSENQTAVLCGVCRYQLRISEYMAASSCPHCAAAFNPGCTAHYPQYFTL